MNIQVARLSGSLSIEMTLTLKRVSRTLSGKYEVIFEDADGNPTCMSVDDTLTLFISLDPRNSDTKAEKTVQKIKDVIRELSA